MLVNSVIGHGKDLLQMSLASDEYQREVASALDAEDLIVPLTLAVSVVTVAAVELGTSKVMGRFGTSEIGIAKVHLRRRFQLGQQLEVLIVQQAVMDPQIDETRQHGGKDDLKMVQDLQGVNSWRDRQ